MTTSMAYKCKITKILFCSFITLTLLCPSVSINTKDTQAEERDHIIISLGDSYSSGEGSLPYLMDRDTFSDYVFSNKDIMRDIETGNEIYESDYFKHLIYTDWLAHRSANSWSSYLYVKNKNELSLKSTTGKFQRTNFENWFFAACSGATTADVLYGVDVEFQLKTSNNIFSKTSYKMTLIPQINVFDAGVGNDKLYNIEDVDYITITIGGNDAHFAEVIEGAVTAEAFELYDNYVEPGYLKQMINNAKDEFFIKGASRKEIKEEKNESKKAHLRMPIRNRLIKTYDEIRSKMKENSTLLVVGYPRLINESKNIINSYEKKLINEDGVKWFNDRLKEIVKEIRPSFERENKKIEFVDVLPVFNGHEDNTFVDGEDVSFINPVINKLNLNSWSSKRSNYDLFDDYIEQDLKFGGFTTSASMHPNGHKVSQYFFSETDSSGNTNALLKPVDGISAYANAVQDKINYLEKKKNEKSMPSAHSTSTKNNITRDVILTLDVSGSMSGSPIEETKKASLDFVSLSKYYSNTNIGIVTFDSSSRIVADIGADYSELEECINGIRTGSNTNIESGLRKAEEILESSDAKKKIIILMSDGLPNEGLTDEGLYEYVRSIEKKGILVYTIGFFESSSYAGYGQQMLSEISSGDGYHYEINNQEDIVFTFEDIKDTLQGQKYIYIRIACPVDVYVKYGDEILSSHQSDLNTRTSFGTLTFEEEEITDSQSVDEDYDNRIKVLRLKDNGDDYKIYIEGNGYGHMDYTIGFMNEDGEYKDMRKFKHIKITRSTEIDTIASSEGDSILNVDTDGDGKYDVVYRAKPYENGKIVNDIYVVYIAGGVIASIVLLVNILKLKKWFNRRKLKNS